MTTRHETILVIEDEPSISEGLELNLCHEGYKVSCAASGEEGLDLARKIEPDLIILDLMLPGIGGHDVLRVLRREDREMQVVILSALGREEDVIVGLQLGADDYVAKPFSIAELLARIEAALRRDRVRRQRSGSGTASASTAETTLRFGSVVVDPLRREVTRDEEKVKLTSRELDLLLTLVQQPERVFSREQLLERVWGLDYEGTARTVDNFVRALRSKLEKDSKNPRHITTVHGIGYRLVP